MSNKSVRLGIIGLGAQGSSYARFIADGRVPGMTIGAIADIDDARREVAGEIAPNVPFYSDYMEMLKSADIDATITCVPHYLHPEMAIKTLESGRHVMVEKPVGVYTAQVRQLNEVAKKHPDLRFAVMFNQRENPLYQELKRIVDSGDIGQLRHFSWHITTWWRPQGYYEQSAWRATWGGEGGGVLVNQAPHQLDLMQWICGMPNALVSMVGYGFRRDIAVEDDVVALMRYDNGATGVFTTATHDLVGTDRFEILGDLGKIVVNDSATATVSRLTKPEQEISASFSAEEARKIFSQDFAPSDYFTTEELTFESRWGDQHCQALINFAASILEDTPLKTEGAEGINGVLLANAIHLSSWTGQEVPMDFDEGEYLDELNRRIVAEGQYPPQLTLNRLPN